MNFSIACIAFTTVAAWGDQGLGKSSVSSTYLKEHNLPHLKQNKNL